MKLIPLGRTSGIKLFADGIMVVELSTIATDKGEHSAAANAGIAAWRCYHTCKWY